MVRRPASNSVTLEGDPFEARASSATKGLILLRVGRRWSLPGHGDPDRPHAEFVFRILRGDSQGLSLEPGGERRGHVPCPGHDCPWRAAGGGARGQKWGPPVHSPWGAGSLLWAGWLPAGSKPVG